MTLEFTRKNKWRHGKWWWMWFMLRAPLFSINRGKLANGEIFYERRCCLSTWWRRSNFINRRPHFREVENSNARWVLWQMPEPSGSTIRKTSLWTSVHQEIEIQCGVNLKIPTNWGISHYRIRILCFTGANYTKKTLKEWLIMGIILCHIVGIPEINQGQYSQWLSH